ncbi:CsbD family protein [Phaeobacter inhibens]|uniref:CsbD family protein n=1 Tax=Phaeobacter inhibens TaxID=221822 RepID=UPI0021A718BA|nr:CsbD family protein [Phaeobacter inhibens]UWR75466.1 CsbD family protein [Phaeobacter inhibens]UWR79447.1 CsbD family protein [Phaeobacter inhibens]UWS03233.1 CsbD family protein [Phaeobacter inhibens]
MNQDQVKGNWATLKGKFHEVYGELTDDEVEQAKGDREQLVGLLQTKYGKAREEAERELDKFFASV